MENLFDLDVEEIAMPSFEETGSAEAAGYYSFHQPLTGRVCTVETGCIC
ncbi:hypothetical protein ACIHFE_21605 [Streptomyces sp. NPDC052396]